MLTKQKSPSLPRNLALGIFGKLPIVFSKKVNLLYLRCSTTQRCCFLHLISSLYNSLRLFANADVIVDLKSNITVSRCHFFAGVIFSATLKVQNYQNKTGKKLLYPNKACLLHISRNFKDILKYICFLRYL